MVNWIITVNKIDKNPVKLKSAACWRTQTINKKYMCNIKPGSDKQNKKNKH